MRNYGHRTTIFIDSVHEPTDTELRAVVDATLAAGQKQGFEPYRAITMPSNPKDDSQIVELADVKANWKRSIS